MLACENLLWGIINSVTADIVIVMYDIVVVICRISHKVGIGGGVITPPPNLHGFG